MMGESLRQMRVLLVVHKPRLKLSCLDMSRESFLYVMYIHTRVSPPASSMIPSFFVTMWCNFCPAVTSKRVGDRIVGDRIPKNGSPMQGMIDDVFAEYLRSTCVGT